MGFEDDDGSVDSEEDSDREPNDGVKAGSWDRCEKAGADGSLFSCDKKEETELEATDVEAGDEVAADGIDSNEPGPDIGSPPRGGCCGCLSDGSTVTSCALVTMPTLYLRLSNPFFFFCLQLRTQWTAEENSQRGTVRAASVLSSGCLMLGADLELGQTAPPSCWLLQCAQLSPLSSAPAKMLHSTPSRLQQRGRPLQHDRQSRQKDEDEKRAMRQRSRQRGRQQER
jgi:hypothetical protein